MGDDRPLWLGFVCWVLIISGTYGLYTTMKVLGTKAFVDSMSNFPYPAGLAEGIVFVTLVGMIVSGICMYERQGWARWIYILVMPVFFFQRFLAVTAPPPLATDQSDAQDPLYLQTHLREAPAHTKEQLILAGLVVLYLLSLWVLFAFRTRRYFHPPMYVDE
jgi:hypothetical protein